MGACQICRRSLVAPTTFRQPDGTPHRLLSGRMPTRECFFALGGCASSSEAHQGAGGVSRRFLFGTIQYQGSLRGPASKKALWSLSLCSAEVLEASSPASI